MPFPTNPQAGERYVTQAGKVYQYTPERTWRKMAQPAENTGWDYPAPGDDPVPTGQRWLDGRMIWVATYAGVPYGEATVYPGGDAACIVRVEGMGRPNHFIGSATPASLGAFAAPDAGPAGRFAFFLRHGMVVFHPGDYMSGDPAQVAVFFTRLDQEE